MVHMVLQWRFKRKQIVRMYHDIVKTVTHPKKIVKTIDFPALFWVKQGSPPPLSLK